eukprot:m.82581 g.82581  ORF g.82581 m.82581 type:complete len:51 (-) comp14621_c0_seq5:1206-1358(-)
MVGFKLRVDSQTPLPVPFDSSRRFVERPFSRGSAFEPAEYLWSETAVQAA